jgi:hypothetical protein
MNPAVLGCFKPKVVSESYTGPLDLVPGAVVAYSMRAMTAGSTANAIRVRRSSDDAEQSFALVNNAVDTASVATFLGGSDPFVRTWFDLSGNSKDAGQATAANQPSWVSSGPNSKPSISWPAGPAVEKWLTTATDVTLPDGAYTVFVVMKGPDDGGHIFSVATDDDSSYVELSANNSGVFTYEANDAANTGNVAKGVTDAVAFQTYGLADVAWQFGSRNFRWNGATVSSTNNDSGGAIPEIAYLLTIGGIRQPVSGDFDGEIVELLIYNGIMSDGNRLLLRQNIATYYGITLP